MSRPVIFCLLATLLVCASAIPKFRESSEEDFVLKRLEDGQYVKGNLDTNLAQGDVPLDQVNYRNSFGSESKQLSVGGWWDSKGVHNLTVGFKSYQDSLLLVQVVLKPYKFLRVQDEYVRYPVTSTSDIFRITAIEAFDTHEDESSAGYARIKSGGVGNRDVTIHLQSRRNHGLKYVVRIWGRRV